MEMNLFTALLNHLFEGENAGGKTMRVTVTMVTPTLCSYVCRLSTCGGDTTEIAFKPALPVEEALLHAAKYTKKGWFEHQQN
jgi:hypothetical protein